MNADISALAVALVAHTSPAMPRTCALALQGREEAIIILARRAGVPYVPTAEHETSVAEFSRDLGKSNACRALASNFASLRMAIGLLA